MKIRVLIADYNDARRKHLADLLKVRFPDCDVDELQSRPPDPTANLDVTMLQRVRARPYDLLIGHIGGNPSGAQCLTVFKEHNRTGRAVLYTKNPEIKISDFDSLKLADRIFQRSAVDNKLFDDADKMFTLIRDVMERPAINTARLPLREPVVIAAAITALLGLLGVAVTALLTYLKPIAKP